MSNGPLKCGTTASYVLFMTTPQAKSSLFASKPIKNQTFLLCDQITIFPFIERCKALTCNSALITLFLGCLHLALITLFLEGFHLGIRFGRKFVLVSKGAYIWKEHVQDFKTSRSLGKYSRFKNRALLTCEYRYFPSLRKSDREKNIKARNLDVRKYQWSQDGASQTLFREMMSQNCQNPTVE